MSFHKLYHENKIYFHFVCHEHLLLMIALLGLYVASSVFACIRKQTLLYLYIYVYVIFKV